MSLLPSTASFQELVHDCFLAYRGSGLMISALDADLLEEWASARVPFEVVARGIRRAAEARLWDVRPGEPALRSLSACRRQVNAEIKKYLSRAVGRSGSAPSQAAASDEPGQGASAEDERWELLRHARMKSALGKIGRAHPELERALSALRARFASPPRTLEEVDRREDVLRVSLLRALPFPARLEVLREAAQLAQPGAYASSRARRLSRRFHRAAVLWHRLDLPAL